MAEYSDELNLADLVELLKGGAKIKIDRPAQRIAGFDDLVKAISELNASNRARAEAEGARNQVQLEVIASLQALIKSQNVSKSQTFDLTPLKSVLAEIQKNSRPAERTGYVFNVERTNQGFIEKIIAIPQQAA